MRTRVHLIIFIFLSFPTIGSSGAKYSTNQTVEIMDEQLFSAGGPVVGDINKYCKESPTSAKKNEKDCLDLKIESQKNGIIVSSKYKECVQNVVGQALEFKARESLSGSNEIKVQLNKQTSLFYADIKNILGETLFKKLNKDSRYDGPNCFNHLLHQLRLDDDHINSDLTFLLLNIQEGNLEIVDDPRFGDGVIMVDEKADDRNVTSKYLHGGIYLSNGMMYHKGGYQKGKYELTDMLTNSHKGQALVEIRRFTEDGPHEEVKKVYDLFDSYDEQYEEDPKSAPAENGPIPDEVLSIIKKNSKNKVLNGSPFGLIFVRKRSGKKLQGPKKFEFMNTELNSEPFSAFLEKSKDWKSKGDIPDNIDLNNVIRSFRMSEVEKLYRSSPKSFEAYLKENPEKSKEFYSYYSKRVAAHHRLKGLGILENREQEVKSYFDEFGGRDVLASMLAKNLELSKKKRTKLKSRNKMLHDTYSEITFKELLDDLANPF